MADNREHVEKQSAWRRLMRAAAHPEGNPMSDTQTGREVDTQTGEIVPADQPGTDVEVASTSPQLAAFLASADAVQEEDAEQVSMQIVARILEATSVDDILNRQTVLAAEDLLMIPVELDGVTWHKSAYEDGARMYALVNGRRVDNQAPILVACGGRNVMAQLFALDRINAFPLPLQFGRSQKPTAAGYYPLWLEPAPAQF